jgi:tRNA(Ile2) C34 agmatinyltransferase TiaS
MRPAWAPQDERDRRMSPYCPDCGGRLNWDRKLKHYSCESCGLTYNEAQLSDAMDKKFERPLSEDEKTRKRHDDYLEWWLSDKDKKKK